MSSNDPVCPGCGTVYNRVAVIREIRKQSPFLFEMAMWTTRFRCIKCRAEIVISGAGAAGDDAPRGALAGATPYGSASSSAYAPTRFSALERLWWNIEDASGLTWAAFALWIAAVPTGVLSWELTDGQHFWAAVAATLGVNFFAMSMLTAPVAYAAWQYAFQQRKGSALLTHAALTLALGVAPFVFG